MRTIDVVRSDQVIEMGPRYRQVDAMEGIRQLVAALSKTECELKSRNVIYFLHSAKRIHLISLSPDPPRSALVRRYNDFTLGYTTETPFGNPALDHQVEVVRTQDDWLQFLENGDLLTPHELAIKLLDLVAAQAESS